MHRILAAIAALTFALGAGGQLFAQHATAFDLQDGGRAYQNVCANCHGPDGDLIAGIDLGRGQFRRPLSDDDIVNIILNGIPNTPMPATPQMSEPQAAQIVAYLRATAAARSDDSVSGDARRGRVLFEGEAECLNCHQVDGRGSRLGPDLSRVGSLRRAAELERSLLDPQAEIRPAHRFVSLTPRRAAAISGRLLNQDPFTIQIMDETENLRSFDKAELEGGVEFIDSPMPSLVDRFDAAQIADLVSYLISLKGVVAQ
jgi:putative heme-binding domain-containing protein